MQMTEKFFNTASLPCLLTFPEAYEEGRRYPVLFFLHGAGTRGTDPELLKQNDFYRGIEEIKDFPFITAAPHCAADSWFDIFEKVIGLARAVAKADFAEPGQFYGIGASMGGYGIWQLAMSCPELFAAIVPISGGGMYWNAARLQYVAVWAFHGAEDQRVLSRESVKMVEELCRAGGEARLTLYPNCRHNAWSTVYRNKEVYQWLLMHRGSRAAISSRKLDVQQFG